VAEAPNTNEKYQQQGWMQMNGIGQRCTNAATKKPGKPGLMQCYSDLVGQN
jgi:hypothetical protein